ncbi:MAG: PEP-CTERM sorting domain-containing protein [Pirellulales bacterium]
MNLTTRILPFAAGLIWIATAATAWAQLPVATGRQFNLSNAAWKVFIPSTYQPRPGDVADLLVHFHGDPQTVWNNAQYAKLNTIILTVNYSGLSSVYTTPFSNQSLFQSILNEALAKVRQQGDIPDTLQWDKLGVSSFSAGYGAVREILKSATYRDQIDAVLAADSLYASTAGDGTPLDSQMADYKTFAALAKNGQKTFLFSHSQVPTPTYESTGECGDELMQHLGITATPTNTNGLGTLHFYRRAESGNFKLWGASGSDGDAHLEHLRYIGEFFEELPLAKQIPEPSTLLMATFTATALALRRRRLSA